MTPLGRARERERERERGLVRRRLRLLFRGRSCRLVQRFYGRLGLIEGYVLDLDRLENMVECLPLEDLRGQGVAQAFLLDPRTDQLLPFSSTQRYYRDSMSMMQT